MPTNCGSPVKGYSTVNDISDDLRINEIAPILHHLREHGVFFAGPLDLDHAMLSRFTTAYTTLESRERGPDSTSDPTAAVIGEEGTDPAFWATPAQLELLRWYRYLFLSRSKPSTHLRALGHLTDGELAANAPEVLTALIERIKDQVGL